jgi:clan AA aspartic protease
MNPYLDGQNNPHLKVDIFLSSWEGVDCLIDSGFSGGIALPVSLHSAIKQKPIVYQEYELADGSFKTFSIYKARVRFKEVNKEITLLFTKSKEGLVGIEFLTGFRLVLDLKKFKIKLS